MEVPSNNVLSMVAPGRNPDAPDPKYLMMAAAQMHAEGRLFEPTPMGPAQAFEKTPNQRVNEGYYDASKPKKKFYEHGDDTRYINQQGDVIAGKIT